MLHFIIIQIYHTKYKYGKTEISCHLHFFVKISKYFSCNEIKNNILR